MGKRIAAGLFAAWGLLVGALGVGARHGAFERKAPQASHALGDFGSGAFWAGPQGNPGSLPPNGPAGGYLAGTYPNPTFLSDAGILSGLTAGGQLSGTYPNPSVNNSNCTTVFKPGGVASGNTYTTWATESAATALCPGARWIYIDDTVAPAHMTTGGPYDLDQVTLFPRFDSSTFTLIIDVGATFTSTSLTVVGALLVQSNATAPVWTPSGDSQLIIQDESQVITNVAHPLIQVNSAANFFDVLIQSNGVLGDGTHNVISVATGQTTLLHGYTHGEILAHAYGGLGTLTPFLDSSSQVNATQDIGAISASTFQDNALQVLYSPGTVSNWNPSPAIVSSALDQLAAPNFVQAQNNTGTGTGTVTAVTGNITKARSGKVAVSGVVTGTCSAGATMTVSLLRDSSQILTLPALTELTTDSFDIPINFIDTLPNTSAHTYTVKGVASTGNVTVGTGGLLIQATEY